MGAAAPKPRQNILYCYSLNAARSTFVRKTCRQAAARLSAVSLYPVYDGAAPQIPPEYSLLLQLERCAFNLCQENMPTSRCAAFGSFPQPCLRWGLPPPNPRDRQAYCRIRTAGFGSIDCGGGVENAIDRIAAGRIAREPAEYRGNRGRAGWRRYDCAIAANIPSTAAFLPSTSKVGTSVLHCRYVPRIVAPHPHSFRGDPSCVRLCLPFVSPLPP
jgi:hypothetical protein